jgi:hypothetical protein
MPGTRFYRLRTSPQTRRIAVLGGGVAAFTTAAIAGDLLSPVLGAVTQVVVLGGVVLV